MESSWPPTECYILFWGHWGLFVVDGESWVYGLDGNNNGQVDHTALYSTLPLPVVPPRLSSQGQIWSFCYGDLPQPPPLLQPELRSMAVNLGITPQGMMFAPSAGIQKMFLWEWPNPPQTGEQLWCSAATLAKGSSWLVCVDGNERRAKLNIHIKGPVLHPL